MHTETFQIWTLATTALLHKSPQRKKHVIHASGARGCTPACSFLVFKWKQKSVSHFTSEQIFTGLLFLLLMGIWVKEDGSKLGEQVFLNISNTNSSDPFLLQNKIMEKIESIPARHSDACLESWILWNLGPKDGISPGVWHQPKRYAWSWKLFSLWETGEWLSL